MQFLAITLCLVALLASANSQKLMRPPPPKRNPPPPPVFAPNCTFLVGGATSISTDQSSTTPAVSAAGFAFTMMNLFNQSKTAFGKYYAVGSGAGIRGFTNKSSPVYCTAFSDDPMSDAQETAFNGQYPQPSADFSFKLTIPAVLAGYGFFANAGTKTTRKTQTLRLTGVDVYNIYYGGGNGDRYSWKSAKFQSAKDGKVVSNTTDSAFLASTIIPYSRSDSSGTTALFKTFFYYAKCGAPGVTCPAATLASLPAELTTISSAPFPAPWVTADFVASGTAALCTAASAQLGAVAYSQRAICGPKVNLVEIAIKNKAGSYVTSLQADGLKISQAAPITIPAFDKPWKSVTLLYSNGAATPPIVSYVYFFIRKRYPASQFPLVSKFALYITSQNSALLNAQSAELLVSVNVTRLQAANSFIKTNVFAY